ncbi:hypothetical protein [Calothrix sp. NIES-2098]|uniref:hypothetical protein n=1 Tax=Calothrix sp. NIES-2098 TaxID=1954171 RepID=UPI0030DCB4BD
MQLIALLGDRSATLSYTSISGSTGLSSNLQKGATRSPKRAFHLVKPQPSTVLKAYIKLHLS